MLSSKSLYEDCPLGVAPPTQLTDDLSKQRRSTIDGFAVALSDLATRLRIQNERWRYNSGAEERIWQVI